ncbi:MAG: VWA domain-containing protein [Acidobacteria bacterium]|nr:VWA domain-containing protein [Acidobacteriota bacterium]MCW5949331.1 VWA domain-containing protein [Pyrinomonadaceae bacterium]
MNGSILRLLAAAAMALAAISFSQAQTLTRSIDATSAMSVDIVNPSGRVIIRTIGPDADEKPSIVARSDRSISEAELTVSAGKAATVIRVVPLDTRRRIDLEISVPERASARIETVAGGIDVVGDLSSVTAKTETGTIATDLPNTEIGYLLTWTESKPRVVADAALEKTREKAAGRFEIKGTIRLERVGPITKADGDATDEPATREKKNKKGATAAGAVSLNFTTARGIILLNVPPNEVGGDLRERPLTNAAKAIVRSGDSLLMEAIRRSAPKYFADYLRSLPPIKQEPRISEKSSRPEVPAGGAKTATVRVTDIKNRSVPGLTAADFEVTENGVAREIVSVERSTAPFNLVLLVDVSGSVENYVNFIRKAARAFVDTVEKDDKVAIVIFNDDVKVLSDLTTDKKRLSASLDSFDAGGATAYYDALAYTLADTLRPLRGERSAIVVLTDGDDNRSFLAFDSLAGAIEESGALIYPLYVPSGLIAAAASGASIDPMRNKYMSLSARSEGEGEKLAKISGGVYYPISEIGQIQKAYEDIVLQLRSAYNVTFRSDTASSGVSPRLKIRSRREGTYSTITAVANK